MGFGSYDEPEQGGQNVDFDEEDSVTMGKKEHKGEVDFKIGAPDDELLDRLQEIKDE